MKKGTRKALLALCCAMILVAISVGATLAYLTDSEAVTNTFTVGQVGLKLDEAKVGDDGKALTGNDAARVKENAYHLLPGQVYDKDPTITIDDDSEDCYVVAKIDVTGMTAANNPMVYGDKNLLGFGGVVTGGVFNGTFAQNATSTVDGATATWKGEHSTYGEITLAQVVNKAGEDYTFYIYFEKPQVANAKLVLFEKLNIPGEWINKEIAALQGMKINISAYAVQEAGMADVFAAYNAGVAAGWRA